MSPIERILCPMHPEWPACSALRYSVALAERFHASLDVVHAFAPGRSCIFPPDGRAPERAGREQQLRECLAEALNGFTAGNPGRAKASVIEGQPLPALLSHAKSTGCDLVVVGSERPRDNLLAFSPSVGEAVAHHADCAVLSLREGETARSPLRIERVLLAVDFSDTTELAIDWTAALVRRFGARLRLLHVRNTSSPPRAGFAGLARDARVVGARLTEVERQLALRGVQVELAALADGCVASHVVDHANSGDCDLIVLGAHERGGAPAVTIRGVVADVRRHSRVPVLSVRRARPEVLFASPMFGDSVVSWERAVGASAGAAAYPARVAQTGG